ncbi:MAG: hypothetical protein AB8B57_12705 [Congregibacter sp.]
MNDLHSQNNNLTGAIPSHLSELNSLEELGLLKNSLSDPIPPDLGMMSSLESTKKA